MAGYPSLFVACQYVLASVFHNSLSCLRSGEHGFCAHLHDAWAIGLAVEGPQGNAVRKYQRLALERDKVYFLPLTWTIVHPVDETSPLKGLTFSDLETLQAEFLILIKGYDDTFSQTVHSRFSYRYDELVWGARFSAAFDIDSSGDVILDTRKVGAFTKVD